MQSDKTFGLFPDRPVAAWNGPGFDASRSAVLWPITGVPVASSGTALAAAYLAAMGQYRARLSLMQQAGWQPLQDPDERKRWARIMYARNCPPFGVRHSRDSKMRTCKRLRLCPWCYARGVVYEMYRAIEWGCLVAGRAIMPHCKLVTIKRSWPGKWPLPAALVITMAKQLLHDVTDDKRIKPELLACYAATSLDPDVDGFTVSRATVLLLPRDFVMGDAKGGEVRITETPDNWTDKHGRQYWRESLSRLVSWAVPYPMGMLRAPVERAIDVLALTTASRARFTSCRGLFRNYALRDSLRRAVRMKAAVQHDETESKDDLHV